MRKSNPGLSNRVSRRCRFPEDSTEELRFIFEIIAIQNHYHLRDELRRSRAATIQSQVETNMKDADARFEIDNDEDSSSWDIVVGIIAALMTAVVGGYLCGLVIDQFGEVGSISLWGLGFVSGLAANKAAGGGSRFLAMAMIVGCIGAFVVAETCWIHWNIKDAETLPAALAKFPLFLKEFKVTAFIAGIFTLFGAHSAYQQVASLRPRT